jgi:hypothetical protein
LYIISRPDEEMLLQFPGLLRYREFFIMSIVGMPSPPHGGGDNVFYECTTLCRSIRCRRLTNLCRPQDFTLVAVHHLLPEFLHEYVLYAKMMPTKIDIEK